MQPRPILENTTRDWIMIIILLLFTFGLGYMVRDKLVNSHEQMSFSQLRVKWLQEHKSRAKYALMDANAHCREMLSGEPHNSVTIYTSDWNNYNKEDFIACMKSQMQDEVTDEDWQKVRKMLELEFSINEQ
ncbi:MAG: hypothetical protein GVY17_00020 [Cyanobacteria bacterium]|jgi:hypothetical protein|nr:hypothetical protein [Cyanobacteria bacterium GSL.Bin21]